MVLNTDSACHLAKSVLGCALLSACSQWSSTVVGGGGGITRSVRWGSFVVIFGAMYYLQYQVCKRCWQTKLRRRERRVRGAYRRARTTGSMMMESASGSSDGNNNNNNNNNNNSSAIRTGSPVSDVMEDVELEASPSPDSSEVWVEGAVVVSNNVYYPELTMSSVWTYVYGWGVLLFVCAYCLSGLDAGSSCWWALGMTALALDELIAKGVRKWLICVIGLGLCGSIFAVWSGELTDADGNFVGDLMFARDDAIVDFVLGMALPVSTPFIFFTIRSTVRSVTQDVTKLCEFALPFMTVLAACFLVATSGVCGVEDAGSSHPTSYYNSHSWAVNGSLTVETVAKFAESYVTGIENFTSINSIRVDPKAVECALIFVAPLLAFCLVRVLVVAILTQHATEFIAAFVLVAAARFGMLHAVGVWSVVGVSGAGFAFVLLLFDR
jgi:hypothetical protein